MVVFLVSCLVLHVAGCGPSVEADLANIVLVLHVKARPWSKAPGTDCFGEEGGAEGSGSGFWLASQLSASPGAHVAWGAFVKHLCSQDSREMDEFSPSQ